ncbi:hypothetical protein R1flu_018138 [Riccia fluitans]|uniref:RING-type domain-containing protein n=1 Tax=Riccia fluitans TaxID=41844 RepID=A0ABD1ZEZ3_9MARC
MWLPVFNSYTDPRTSTILNSRSTPHLTRRKMRRMGIVKSKLKKVFTFDFKGIASCSGSCSSTSTSMITGEEFDNKENRPPVEIELPFQENDFEVSSPDMEDDDDLESELPPEDVARLRELLEEEMVRFRVEFQRLGEGFSFLLTEGFKQMLDAILAEYETKFGAILNEGIKAQIRCMFLEDELRKTKESLFHCARKLEAEKGNVMELTNLVDFVKTSLVQVLEKQTCCMCKVNLRNTVILPCMHFLYCSECLHNHQKRSSECPTCQTPIGAAVNLNLKV